MPEKSHEAEPEKGAVMESPSPVERPGVDDPPFTVYPARRRKKRWIMLALAVVLAGACALLWHHLEGFASTDDAQVDVHLYPVSARIAGYIDRVGVGDNQWVTKGTPLVEIDPTDYQVALAKAEAALDASEATARGLKIDVPLSSVDTASTLELTSAEITDAQAAIEAAQKKAAAAHALVLETLAENVKAQDDVTRYRLLLAKEEVPRQIYDHAYAAAASDIAAISAARADQAAAEEAVREARSRLSEAEAQYQDAKAGPQRVASTRARALAAIADVEQRTAAVEQARLNLGYTTIYAPVSGEVTKKVVVGLNVSPGEQMLTVVPLNQVWITANFKETALKHMRVGQRATIHLDSNGRIYRGHVDSIAGATGPIFSLLPPENATGNYVKIVQRVPVKILLEPGEDGDHALRPGMNVEVKVFLR